MRKENRYFLPIYKNRRVYSEEYLKKNPSSEYGIIGKSILAKEIQFILMDLGLYPKVVDASTTSEYYSLKIIGIYRKKLIEKFQQLNCSIFLKQALVDKFNVDIVINTGIAGSLDAAIDIGDMVISTDLVEHDFDASVFGDPVGQVPRMDTFSFPADMTLVEKAVEANKEANPDIKTFTGRIVSGDQFISSSEVKEKLVNLFGAKCTEMEGAAIAHAAYVNKVSCVIIRAISDKADNSATMDYPSFEKKAIEHSVRLVQNFLPRI